METYFKEAIKIAIENGWKVPPLRPYELWNWTDEQLFFCTSDPLFWQALGRGLNWGEHEYFMPCPCCEDIPNGEPRLLTWKYHMHKFINYLADGGNTEDFFKNLLQ